jgi:hypothetical protein
VATCGGYHDTGFLRSCLVLAPGSGWQEGRLGSLGKGRAWAAVTTLPGATFILGGESRAARRTSEVLLAGEDSWREGPALPIDMYYGCAVMISATQLLAIHGSNIMEFDTSVAGPLSTAGWRPASTWPDLTTAKTWHACAATGGRVVLAGGRDDEGNRLKSTEVIDISTHRVTAGPELLKARRRLQLAVLPAPDGEGARVLAIGGYDARPRAGPVVLPGAEGLAIGGRDDDKRLDRVEEWLPGPGGNSTWRQLTALQEARSDFGAVSLPKGLVCQA